MCFGGGSKPQVVSQGTQQVTDKSWETMEPYIKNALESSRARFEDQLETGFEAFPGGYEGRFEGPSVEELAAREGILQQGLSGIAGTGMASARPYYEAGLSALSSSMDQFGPQQAQQYMNPYQQAVVDIAKREAVRQAQPTFRNIGDRAESTGAFGGSRQAIAEAEANRNLQQQLGDIQTRGMQSAFEQGRSAFEAQKAREAAGAQRMFAQAPLAYRQGLSEMAAIEGVGGQRRADEQAKKDFLYNQFMEEKMFPSRIYDEHLGHVRGFSYQPSKYITTTNTQPKASLGQNLMGLAGTAASIYGGMGGFSKGGFGSMFAEGGQVGGLASLASGGQIKGGGFESHQNNMGNYFSVDALNKLGMNTNVIEQQQQQARQQAAVEEIIKIKEKVASNTPLTVQERIKLQAHGESQLPNKVAPDLVDQHMKQVRVKKEADAKAALEPFGGKDLPKESQLVSDDITESIRIQKAREDFLKEPTKERTPVTNLQLQARAREGLMGLLPLEDPEKLRLEDRRNTQIKKYDDIYDFFSNPKELAAKRAKEIGEVYEPLTKELETAKTSADAFRDRQLKLAEEHMTKREADVNKRATSKLAELAARGKKAKERGEQGAMQNLFLNMLLPMSLQGGQDPRGFLAGALQGGKDNMEKFVDRYSKLKDDFATGEEKRAREKTSIEDKKIDDTFALEDVFVKRRGELESEAFKLKADYDKEIRTNGMSKRAAQLKEKFKETDYMLKGAEAAGQALKLKKEAYTDVNDMKRENIDAYAKILDLDMFDPNTTDGAKSQKNFNDKIESERKDLVAEMGFMIGVDDEGNETIMLNKDTPLTEEDRRKWTAKWERRKRDLLQNFLKYGLTYGGQARAVLDTLNTRGSGSSTTGSPQVGATATNANGDKVRWDGSKWVPI